MRNQSEPIQQNLGERIAWLIGKNLEDRKLIVAQVRDVYGVRSRMLHHGQDVGTEPQVTEFLKLAWSALHCVVLNIHRYTCIDQLLEALDNRKLS